MGTGSFPGVKRPGRGVDHPPPSSAEVEGRVQLYLCFPSGPSWPVLGITFTINRRTAKKEDTMSSDRCSFGWKICWKLAGFWTRKRIQVIGLQRINCEDERQIIRLQASIKWRDFNTAKSQSETSRMYSRNNDGLWISKFVHLTVRRNY